MQLSATNNTGNLRGFDAWLKSLDRTRATGHRWRQIYPWLKIVNICGKNYITRESIEEFERRALAGEFAKNIRPGVAKMTPENANRALAGAVYRTEYTATTVTVTEISVKRKGGYVATWRAPEVFDMLAQGRHHKTFILLTVVALRARYSRSPSLDGLSTGEALIGDFENYGLTEQEYRTAKQKLEKWKFATFKATTLGTVVNLLENPIYEYDFKPSNDPINDRATIEQRSSNDRATIEQRSSNDRATDEQRTSND